jgi:hypothetical protein
MRVIRGDKAERSEAEERRMRVIRGDKAERSEAEERRTGYSLW